MAHCTIRPTHVSTGLLSCGVAELAQAGAPVPSSIDPDKPGRTPKTKFAANVEMWWTKLPFLDRVRQAAALGFPAIEFWPWRNKDIGALAALSKELKLDIAQFTAWGFIPGMNEPRNHKHLVQEIKESCRVAKQLDCRKMTVVGGNDVNSSKTAKPRYVLLRNSGVGQLPMADVPRIRYLSKSQDWLLVACEGKGNEQRLVVNTKASSLLTGRHTAVIFVHCPEAVNPTQGV